MGLRGNCHKRQTSLVFSLTGNYCLFKIQTLLFLCHFCISCFKNALVLVHFAYSLPKPLTKTKCSSNLCYSLLGVLIPGFCNILWVTCAMCPTSCSRTTAGGWMVSRFKNSWLCSISLKVVCHCLLTDKFSDVCALVKRNSTHWSQD